MLINGKNRCIFCMNELNEDNTCKKCKKNAKEYKPTSRSLLPGTKLAGRYILGGVLGEGTFGITYVAWDFLMDLPVAIKEYYPVDFVSRDVIRGTNPEVVAFSPEAMEEYQKKLDQFLEESKCLSRFQDEDGIVSVWDVFSENNTAYIVMEYIEGMHLKDYIRNNGPMNEKETLAMMKPVLTALARVHKIGLIHRDISPDNIMIDENGEAKLIDFGAARFTSFDKTKSMTLLFKHGFSPEEQCRPKGKVGKPTDVYAICATMYFMMTGKVPLDAVDRMAGEELEDLSEVSECFISDEMNYVITKGMSVKADQRFPNIDVLINKLFGDGKNDHQEELKEEFIEEAKESQIFELKSENTEENIEKSQRKNYISRKNIVIALLILIVGSASVAFISEYSRKAKLENGVNVQVTERPVISVEPSETSNAEVVSKPKATSKPKDTQKPKVTQKPKATPKPTKKPAVTKKPQVSARPTVTQKPTKVNRPRVTPRPKVKQKPKNNNGTKENFIGSLN